MLHGSLELKQCFVLQLLLATAAMGALLWQCSPELTVWSHWSMLRASLELAKLILLGCLAYGLVLLAAGVRPRHLKTAAEG